MNTYPCSGCGNLIQRETPPTNRHINRLKCGDCKKNYEREWRQGRQKENARISLRASKHGAPWSAAEDAALLRDAGRIPYPKIALALGRSVESVTRRRSML